MTNDNVRKTFELGDNFAGFLPGNIGNVAGGVFGYGNEVIRTNDERKFFRDAGMSELVLQKGSWAARRKLESLDNRPTSVLVKYGLLLASSLVGGWLGAMLLGPLLSAIIPFGLGVIAAGMAGTAVAAFITNRFYEGAIGTAEQDAVTLAAKCHCKVRDGKEPVTDEEAFAALIAALPPKKQARYEAKLYARANTKDFAQALETQEGQRALRIMMEDPMLEEDLRAALRLPVDPRNPRQHIALQYADLVNNGVLDARLVVLNPEQIEGTVRRYYMESMVRNNNPQGAGRGNDAVVSQRQLPDHMRAGQQEI